MKSLIVGVDPGITVGYAAIDFDGNIIAIGSQKNLTLNTLISKIHALGKVVLVGVDKKNNPSFVHNFAVKFGAKVIKPKYDLKVMEKNLLTNHFKCKDDHQKDSLASALFALKENQQLIKKIDSYIKINKKEKIKDKIIELVFLKEKNISDAVKIIEKPDEIKVIEKKVIEDKSPTEKDFIKSINNYKKLEKDYYLVKKQNKKLKNKIKKSEKPIVLKFHDAKSRELLGYKERRIVNFDREIKNREKNIAELNTEISKLNEFLSLINDYYLLKKIKNLGSEEFSKKIRLLNIKKGDFLYIENPSEYSDKLINFLKDNFKIIVYKNKLNNKLKKLPIEFINADKLEIMETSYFAIVKKQELEQQIKELNILHKIIEEYKEERSVE